jgi:hypothetical protein
LDENALILIEEIENGLHPVATRRLTEYLITAAQRKRVQVIFTTHSDDALTYLPHEAVWACLDREVQQGKLSVRALRAISGKIDKALAIFTEDEFSKFVIESLIREKIPEYVEQLEVHPVAGDGNAVRIHRQRRLDPTTRFRSICVLDGDSTHAGENESGIYKLPGAQPERQVFDDIIASLDTKLGVLTVSLLQPYEKQNEVNRLLTDIQRTNRDSHLLFSQVGEGLGFVPETIVKGAFCSLWVRMRMEDLGPIAAAVRREIDAQNAESISENLPLHS